LRHGGEVRAAAFSSDGKRIVTASADHRPRVWDAETGRLLATLTGHTSWVLIAEFSPDGKRIVTASADGTARIYMADLKELLEWAKNHLPIESGK
jgi:WD40 repeat protein